MNEFFNVLLEVLNTTPVQTFWHDLLAGEITLLTGIVWLAVAGAVSILGGAIGGILLARKDLGFGLSAMIGGLFGPVGVLPAIALGLIVLKFV
ncbi:MAG: hypothetical protein WAN66_24720 [Limnoraphis robusta]|uniref:Uncharacterized protein n=3 Tax=Limnoraphis robusta TaxID=1118279 RepID=A0A0F5YMA0_9CYAN|nr:hypothetical protein [Limnoraphis robusta]AAZ73684.1 hypothetical protein [Limnoraphis robusta CCAP 1446/4]KKD40021.1 hypothetical protein WN50_00165 [Limnoraphis robusta CS-951]MEA5517997.1 hypothetical protein [Limnoraphis robusta CCNP1315]MEA5545569.1 hypothetical protein [Limnoraphis robusta CCNP1324]